tara:strand:+ start:698 stop:1549 length:852 start_codon:yes stop_codon:yes gene_type:complete
MIIYDLFTYARNLFKTHDKEVDNGDVKRILEHILCKENYAELFLIRDLKITSEQFVDFKKAVQRRLYSEPIAYIVGNKSFWKHTFKVNKSVLIPRPESELIIENALQEFDCEKKIKILDLGTGSGCLAASLQYEFFNASVTATDISNEALKVAQQNITSLLDQKSISLVQGDWFCPLPMKEKFDLIVANPPYVSVREWTGLQSDVSLFEPRIALTDESSGLSCYRTIISEAHSYLKDRGILILEIGISQEEDVCKMLQANGFKMKVRKDLNGISRTIVAQKTS